MKGVPEMQNLRAAFAITCGQVFAHLPIHCRLQTIFDRKRAALDKKITIERRQTDDVLERLHKFRVVLRVNIRVRDFDFGRAQEVDLHRRIIEIWMIKADRHRAEKAIEINQPPIAGDIVQIRTATFFQVNDDLETVEQNVLPNRLEHVRRRHSFLFFALCGAASK